MAHREKPLFFFSNNYCGVLHLLRVAKEKNTMQSHIKENFLIVLWAWITKFCHFLTTKYNKLEVETLHMFVILLEIYVQFLL